MNCPLSEQTRFRDEELLLDYSAGRLEAARAEKLERHAKGCARCTAFLAEQTNLWAVLDTWEPQPVSTSFNRTLWHKIDQAAAAPWYRKFAESLRFGAWKPVFPLAAAVLVVAAGFVYDHQNTSNVSVSVTEADQVERTLEDIQLLRQFETASTGIANSTTPM